MKNLKNWFSYVRLIEKIKNPLKTEVTNFNRFLLHVVQPNLINAFLPKCSIQLCLKAYKENAYRVLSISARFQERRSHSNYVIFWNISKVLQNFAHSDHFSNPFFVTFILKTLLQSRKNKQNITTNNYKLLLMNPTFLPGWNWFK